MKKRPKLLDGARGWRGQAVPAKILYVCILNVNFKPEELTGLLAVAVYRVLYQSILNAKLTGRKNLGRKRCTSNRDDRKLKNTVKQSWFKHLWELHKEWTEAGVSQCIKTHHAQTSSGKGLPSHFWTRDNIRSVLPGLWRKRTGLLLSGPKSSFQMKVNFAFHLEIKVPESGGRVERHRIHVACGEAQNPCCLKSSVKFPQSVMIWAAMSSAGIGPLCFPKSTVNAAIYQEILEHFMLPSADKLYGDADFIFQQDLAPAHTAKGTKSWFNDHGVTVLDWPTNSPDLNPIENLWGIVKRKMRDTRPNNADELKDAIKETWASIPPQQCHKLITSMPRQIEAVIKAKGAPTKYWVHIQ